jgi:hypothetical protein
LQQNSVSATSFKGKVYTKENWEAVEKSSEIVHDYPHGVEDDILTIPVFLVIKFFSSSQESALETIRRTTLVCTYLLHLSVKDSDWQAESFQRCTDASDRGNRVTKHQTWTGYTLRGCHEIGVQM